MAKKARAPELDDRKSEAMSIRVTAEIKDRIAKARPQGRSLNDEIARRLEFSLRVDDLGANAQELLTALAKIGKHLKEKADDKDWSQDPWVARELGAAAHQLITLLGAKGDAKPPKLKTPAGVTPENYGAMLADYMDVFGDLK